MDRRPYVAVHTPKRPNFFQGISLCSGVAGLDLGLHIAEPAYRTVCYVERNSFPAAALVARMADASLAPAPIWDDLKSFDGKPWRDRVHIITAGYPCQPFTLSGLRKGDDDPRHLWPDVARITAEVAPEWVFFENVPGHLTLGLKDVIADLQNMGYRVAARVVSAAEVGGTHTRERLFILGHANRWNEREFCVPQPQPVGNGLQNQPKPDRHSNRPVQTKPDLDVVLGPNARSGLERRNLPMFPPAPSDIAKWRKTLDERPELKPCLHRLDDGMVGRVDRHAAAGNGVVPLAAAHAYCALRAELED
jgi:DNA (cytosine-5)-methyltransferase 1